MTQGGGAGGGLEGCAGSEGRASAAATGRGSKGMGRGGSKNPSGMEEEEEHTNGVTGEIVVPGRSRAVLGTDFLEYLAETRAILCGLSRGTKGGMGALTFWCNCWNKSTCLATLPLRSPLSLMRAWLGAELALGGWAGSGGQGKFLKTEEPLRKAASGSSSVSVSFSSSMLP